MGYYGNASINNIEIPIGDQFENALRNAMGGQTMKVKNKNGTAMDVYEGTDFMYCNMRIDATVNFSGKKWMPYIADTGVEILPGQNLKVGIRHGNAHDGYTEFPEPVVVIGCDCADGNVYEEMSEDVLAALARNAETIENFAVDAYADYTETEKEERDCLFSTPLRPNPNYRRPRHLGKRFKELNDFQDSIMTSKIQEDQQFE
jgi:hypothetical protein